MKKHLWLVAALLILTLLCACSPAPTPEDEIRTFYTEYVEAVKKDRVSATIQYVHFEDKRMEAAFTQSSNNTLYLTDILSMEQLSDNLWVLEIYYESVAVPSGNTAYHFVGKIDGERKVMRNWENVPAELAQDIDFTKYMPDYDNIVDIDDIIDIEDIIDIGDTIPAE